MNDNDKQQVEAALRHALRLAASGERETNVDQLQDMMQAIRQRLQLVLGLMAE